MDRLHGAGRVDRGDGDVAVAGDAELEAEVGVREQRRALGEAPRLPALADEEREGVVGALGRRGAIAGGEREEQCWEEPSDSVTIAGSGRPVELPGGSVRGTAGDMAEELDRRTILAAAAGGRAAQDAFLRRYARPLHALLARSGLRDPDDATQELLAKLLEVLPRFDPDGPAKLTTWVFTVAHRFLVDERRRRHLALVPLEDGLAVADEAPGPERAASSRELARDLEAALATLPDAQRRVFLLACVHGQPLEAIAEVKAVPVGTLKSRLHRARAALALALAPEEGADRALSR